MALDLTELRSQSITALVGMARDLGIDNANGLRKQELIFEVVRHRVGRSNNAIAEGVLEILPDGFGFLRWPDVNFLPGPDDVYVSPSQIRRFNLRTGDTVKGVVRAPKEGERYFALIKIESINGGAPDTEREKILFDNLTPVPATNRLRLAGKVGGPTATTVDMIAPMGLGHRVALMTPPGADGSAALRQFAQSARQQHPELHVVLCMVGERPEEVTVARRVGGLEVFSSDFDEPATRHVQVAEMALERVRRLVEQGRDVLVLVDSITSYARACQATAAAGGRALFGVADVAALQRVRRLFGAGRCLEEGGSLTLVGTVAAETGDAFDTLLIRELGGAANVCVVLRPDLTAGASASPPVDVEATFTRRPERMLSAAELAEVAAHRRQLAAATSDEVAALVADAALLSDRSVEAGASAGAAPRKKAKRKSDDVERLDSSASAGK